MSPLNRLNTAESEAQANSIKAISFVVRAKLALQLLRGEGSVNNLVQNLKKAVNGNLAATEVLKTTPVLPAVPVPLEALDYDGLLEPVPEAPQTIAILKVNFEKTEPKLQTGIPWESIEARLLQEPERLKTLERLMIERNGDLTVTALLPNGKFRFDELSAEPPGKTKITYAEAEAIAKDFAAKLMEPKVYESFKEKDVALDIDYTWSYLNTPKNILEKEDNAIIGSRGRTGKRNVNLPSQDGGCRLSFEI